MNKSPEEYFAEQDFSPLTSPSESGEPVNFSPMERAFMDKYIGVHEGEVLQKLGIDTSGGQECAPDQHPEMAAELSLDTLMRDEAELQMVGFFLGGQEFTIPTMAVQEVIRSMPIAKLPAAPPSVAGVINLRGKVTPLIRLRDMLEVSTPRLAEDKFIVVCRRHGLQIGMLIERVHTMYRVPQEDIDWSIEAHLGINVDFIAGLLKLREQLVGIVSVDRIMACITQ